jgi:DNA polymerase-1
MIRIDRGLVEKGLEARLLVQVHDELVFEVPHEELDVVRDFVVTEMEGAMELAVPLEVDVGVGASWYDCKG